MPQRGDDTQPIPTGDLETAKEATTRAVWRLHVRFVLLAVALTSLVAGGMVVYSVINDHDTTRVFLTDTASHAARTAKVLRRGGDLSNREVIERAADLTDCEMALLTREGAVVHATQPRLKQQLRTGRWPRADTPRGATKLLVTEGLGDLSGLWWIGPYDEAHRLLVIVPRSPEDEGQLQYMTFAAGITGAGVLVMLAIMLAAANWMLRRPLEKLIDALTSALVRDVKRRKAAEERANEARVEAEGHSRFLDNLLNASEDVAIVAAGRGGRVNLFNDVAETVSGLTADEVVGVMSLEELSATLQPPSGDAEQSDLLQPFAQQVDGEQQIVDRQGGKHFIQVSTSPIKDPDGTTGGTLMIFTDITEQRRVEAELRSKQMQLIQSSRMATLGEMATGVAHEINQPLNHIGLLSTRLLRRVRKKNELDADDVEFLRGKLQSIEEQVGRAAKIIDHLRTFGRVEPAVVEAIAVGDAIGGTLELLGEQVRLHNVVLDVDVPDDLPPALGDVPQLEQVLINLVVNARFALDGHEKRRREEGDEGFAKQLTIRARPGMVRRRKPGVLIEVADNGPGMSQEVASRVFEPFFTTKDVGDGTGLGLSISYGIVRDFGGTLSVRTAPGEGATFTVALLQATGEEGVT